MSLIRAEIETRSVSRLAPVASLINTLKKRQVIYIKTRTHGCNLECEEFLSNGDNGVALTECFVVTNLSASSKVEAIR